MQFGTCIYKELTVQLQELSLRPYSGRLFLTRTVKDYEQAHLRLFGKEDTLNCAQAGRFSGAANAKGLWTYLVFGRKSDYLVHEFAHVVLHVFARCGIDPIEANGEPFCCLLSQLFLDSKS